MIIIFTNLRPKRKCQYHRPIWHTDSMANFDTTKNDVCDAKCCCICMINHIFCAHFDANQIMPINCTLKRCICMYGFVKIFWYTQIPSLNCMVNHIPNAPNRAHIKNGGKPAPAMLFSQSHNAQQWKTWFTTQVYHLFWYILSKSQKRYRFTSLIHNECRV